LPRAEFANPAGPMQVGFVCAMLDYAISVAASMSQRLAVIVPILQTSVSYFRPTLMARVIARRRVTLQPVKSRNAGGAAERRGGRGVPRPLPGSERGSSA